jgi:hypothetical protein
MDFRYTHDDFEGGAYNFAVTRHNLGGIGWTAADELAGRAPPNGENDFSALPCSDTISVNFATINDYVMKFDYEMD